MSKRAIDFFNEMTLEEKVGQMLCYGFCGTYPHPDLLEVIEKYHVAGFRITPVTRKFRRYFGPDHPGTSRVTRPLEPLEREYGASGPSPRVGARRYAEVLNVLRQRSLESGAGVPLYFTLDFEGNESMDFHEDGTVGFPHPMGLTASRDPDLCRRAARTIGQQLKAVGINWVHSPVLDVNTTPTNPEIGTRSYSPFAEDVAHFGAASLKGFDEAGVIAVAKHFPGRGASVEDVHYGIAEIAESEERMQQVHLAPYKALIPQGLPAIMLAHSIYPSIDSGREIATISRQVVGEVLREQLQFDGVVMTDSFTMGGLVARYEVAEAAIRAIEAGVDLILLKDENALRGEVFYALVDAARKGRISEERLNNAVRRVLEAKERAGLFDGNMGLVDPDQAESDLTDSSHQKVAKEAAERSVVLLRDRKNLLPLSPGTKIFVVEEVAGIQHKLNNLTAHTGVLAERLLELGFDVTYADFSDRESLEQIWKVIEKRAEEADVIIHTGFFSRGKEARRELHARFSQLNKPTVFVTNCPYSMVVDDTMDTVVVNFTPLSTGMCAAADTIVGELEPQTELHFDPEKTY